MEPKETRSAQMYWVTGIFIEKFGNYQWVQISQTCCQINQTSFDCVKLFNQFLQETHDTISISNKLFKNN
jgi:hypothetical protein